MKVKEMITILEAMPSDATIYYFDTWWASEGWGEDADESGWNSIDSITYDEEDNTIKLI